MLNIKQVTTVTISLEDVKELVHQALLAQQPDIDLENVEITYDFATSCDDCKYEAPKPIKRKRRSSAEVKATEEVKVEEVSVEEMCVAEVVETPSPEDNIPSFGIIPEVKEETTPVVEPTAPAFSFSSFGS